jgi:hypothetical protein
MAISRFMDAQCRLLRFLSYLSVAFVVHAWCVPSERRGCGRILSHERTPEHQLQQA